MYKYTITLKATTTIEGLEFISYPIVTRTTQTRDRAIVERATVNRFIRENWGTLSDCTVARISVEKVKEVA